MLRSSTSRLIAIFVRLEWREAELGIVLLDHAVLGRGPVFADHSLGAELLGLAGDDAQRRFLDLAAEHPAAHQPGIHEQIAVVDHAADDDGDDAVVAEAVEQAQLQPEGLRILHQREHVFVGIAPRRQIELVGLVDELNGALQPDLVEPPPDQVHLQAAQIGRQIGRLLLPAFRARRWLDRAGCARDPRP